MIRTENDNLSELLYTAPELMRDGASSTVTKSADVYSFAIVCAEIAMKRAAWETEESGVDVDGEPFTLYE